MLVLLAKIIDDKDETIFLTMWSSTVSCIKLIEVKSLKIYTNNIDDYINEFN